MKTLLVPTDFSKSAENALEYALAMAKQHGHQIQLLNVCPVPYEFSVRLEDAITAIEDDAQHQLKRTISKIRKNPEYSDISCEAVTTVGRTVHSIVDYAHENKISLMIMGTKGVSGLSRSLIGSNSAEVIKRSSTPVLVVPQHASYHTFNKIIYAVDYLDDSLKSLEKVMEDTKIFNMSHFTVHIASKENLKEEMMHHNFKALVNEKIPNRFVGHELVYDESPVKGLQRHMAENENALYVLIRHSKHFRESLWNTSISEELVYQSSTPVLILRSEERELAHI